ncbi:sulfatase family protein [Verrucomicrobiota bacterium sgz303538]
MRRIFLLPLFLFALLCSSSAAERPNIIWIVGEDLGPELGCYGDSQAITPNMDRIAREGARFTRCFTHAPVCAPSRHGLITGQYPIKTGAHHMRSTLISPPETFTKLLRDSGYFVAWPGKTDFNFKEPQNFADSRANWLKSPAPKQPFFAYMNLFDTHESQIRNDGNKFAQNTKRLTSEQRHDPAKMQLPLFWPDAPEVRRELANYYDLATAIDYTMGDILQWIDDNGIADNTVVIFFGDHGRGMPRYKRWVYDTGTHVPLMVRWPGKIKPETVREDLVSFVDLPATALALGGVEIPQSFDGQVILGPQTAPERKYVYAHRDYMDETLDRIRSVRDKRFRYVRNFHPELPYAQEIDYMEIGKTMQVWRRWNSEGKLNAVQKLFFAPNKPDEELYDSEADPFEINNIATDPKYADKLVELRAACDEWIKKTNDMGAIPAEELVRTGVIKERNSKYAERLKDVKTGQ